MSNKFTPGPWVIYDDESPIVLARKDGENYDIASIPNEYLSQEEIQGNARLIAAAPEMIEMLDILQKVLAPLTNNPVHEDVMKQLDYLIKKATA